LKDEFMGTTNPQTREAMGRLALSCSALARAGQVLSTVTDPAKTNEALQQAASILESDARVSRLPQMESVALECQSALSGVAEGESLAVCRKLATKLARLASSLATEVQEQSRKAGKAETKPAVPAPSTAAAAPTRGPVPQPTVTAAPKPVPAAPASVPPAAPVKPIVKPAPVPAPAVRAAPEKRPAKPKVDLTPIRVAASAEERTAVTATLEAGQRFANVKNGTLIDTRMNLMWASKVSPAMPHQSAQSHAAGCRLGGYADWRLPRPEELQHFLTGGGRELGAAMFQGEGGGTAVALWTSETSRKFLFIRQATAVQVRSGAAQTISASLVDVHVLVVRSAPGQR
jgi:outer membrane biosynthesis protein TonB